MNLKRKRGNPGERDAAISVSKTPTQPLKLKSPGSLLKSLRKRFTSNRLKVSPVSSPTTSMQHPLAATPDETDFAPLVQKRLYMHSAKEVAEELTLMDAELLAKIERKELENGAWMKKATKV